MTSSCGAGARQARCLVIVSLCCGAGAQPARCFILVDACFGAGAWWSRCFALWRVRDSLGGRDWS
eukprot:758767-Alexandrium_andersonii.AAC.1